MPMGLSSISNRERNAPSTGVERSVGSVAIRSVMKAAFARGVWNEVRMLMNAAAASQVFCAGPMRGLHKCNSDARLYSAGVARAIARGDACGRYASDFGPPNNVAGGCNVCIARPNDAEASTASAGAQPMLASVPVRPYW